MILKIITSSYNYHSMSTWDTISGISNHLLALAAQMIYYHTAFIRSAKASKSIVTEIYDNSKDSNGDVVLKIMVKLSRRWLMHLPCLGGLDDHSACT